MHCLINKKISTVIIWSYRIIDTVDRPVKIHEISDYPVNLLCGFFLVRFDISHRIGMDEDIIHHPPE